MVIQTGQGLALKTAKCRGHIRLCHFVRPKEFRRFRWRQCSSWHPQLPSKSILYTGIIRISCVCMFARLQHLSTNLMSEEAELEMN